MLAVSCSTRVELDQRFDPVKRTQDAGMGAALPYGQKKPEGHVLQALPPCSSW